MSMRSAVVTLAVACTVAAAIGGVAWEVQAAALPTSTRAERVAAQAVSWFLRYRLVESRFRIGGGGPVRSSCLQGALPAHAATADRGTVLELSTGRTIVDTRHALYVLGAPAGEPTALALFQLELAGCSRIVGAQLASLLQRGGRIRAEHSFVAGYPALALRMSRGNTRLTVYVTPRTFKPFALDVRSAHFSGSARIRLTVLTSAEKRRILARADL
jgi:hypothetical protein